MTAGAVALLPPSLDRLPGFEAALAAGWSPDTTRDISGETLMRLRADRAAFVADQLAETGPIALPDGRVIERLPGPRFWIWDGEFCGAINLRYRPGTDELPPEVPGHIGYSVVPWKRRRGYATRALALILPIARERGLARVQITCDEDNEASRRVIEANGGVLTGRLPAPEHGGGMKLLYWLETGANGSRSAVAPRLPGLDGL